MKYTYVVVYLNYIVHKIKSTSSLRGTGYHDLHKYKKESFLLTTTVNLYNVRHVACCKVTNIRIVLKNNFENKNSESS